MQDNLTDTWQETLHSIENNEHQNTFFDSEARLNKADKNVDMAVSEFVNNLGYNLTGELLKNFDNYRKDSDYSWLTDSDIWLKSIEEVYHENMNKMPGELEKYLLDMLHFLISYKAAKGTLASLSEVMKSEIQVKEISQTTSNLAWENLPPFNSRIKPADGVDLVNA